MSAHWATVLKPKGRLDFSMSAFEAGLQLEPLHRRKPVLRPYRWERSVLLLSSTGTFVDIVDPNLKSLQLVSAE